MTTNESKALKTLRKNDQIVILPTDKGNAIAILNRQDYKDKVNDLLKDSTTYEHVTGEPTKSLRARITKTVTALKKKKSLTEEQAKHLRPIEGPVPRLYGLPKVHKEPCLPHDNHDANSSADFLRQIKGLELEEDDALVSFDVTSLFTNIPKELAIESMKHLISKDDSLRNRTNLSPKELIQLVELCMETYLQFDGRVYLQKRGTPMGSPISGLLADAVMKHFESEAFQTFKPKVWLRYVDDTFVVLPQTQLDQFHSCLNNVIDGITFTREKEENSRLAFLDVLIIRRPDGKLETTVYRKPTTTGVILRFDSNHPACQLKSCVRTLFRRADTHCSSPELRRQERKHLFKLFASNGYPNSFIKASIRGPTRIERAKPRTRMTVPYIHGTSEAVQRMLQPLGIQISHKPNSTLRSALMNAKDHVEPHEQSGVVYAIPCLGCDQQYVGETGKQLRTRVHEHKLAMRRADPRSQLWHHCADTGHEVNIDHAKVVARAKMKGERLVLEALYSRNSFNRHVDIDSHYVSIVDGETKSERRQTDRRTRRHLLTAFTATPVDSNIFGSVRWKLSDSPYIIQDNDLVIASDALLHIEPGVKVYIGPGLTIKVKGTLRARGLPGLQYIRAVNFACLVSG
ncbi:uncharacterized protein DEA37_0004506 [Paragonimus westermani]|uniref:Reverse transcriptase domain-containing protein n=1 Tax=Paragonimus westermani TaxID=34504 RepID=A0A5J4NUA0_9TREM|nr:uncharacterized protein DEA37_0004506 [Paragonimus westermani]